MAALQLAAVMQAIADTAVAQGVVTVAFGYPAETVTPPCLVVGYPETIDFDATFGRGSDRAVFPVHIVVGKAVGKAGRDAVSQYVTGVKGVKDALDGNLGGAVQTARVTDCEVSTVNVNGVEYIAATFKIEVYT